MANPGTDKTITSASGRNKGSSLELAGAAGIALVVIATLVVKQTTELTNSVMVLSGISLVLVTAAVGLFGYLQDIRRTSVVIQRNLTDEMERLELQKLAAMQAVNITPEERSALLRVAEQKVIGDMEDRLAAIWEKKFEAKSEKSTARESILRQSNDILNRLREEIYALGRRANVNLVIGIIISAVGLIVLTWFVWISTEELVKGLSASDAALRFAIRLSLALFIQVFAYFFLRLYRYSIFEIKYFQNEITSAGFRVLAVLSSLHDNDGKLSEKLIMELAKTERNFILKKGESTVGLQRELIERDTETQLAKALEKVLERKDKG